MKNINYGKEREKQKDVTGRFKVINEIAEVQLQKQSDSDFKRMQK